MIYGITEDGTIVAQVPDHSQWGFAIVSQNLNEDWADSNFHHVSPSGIGLGKWYAIKSDDARIHPEFRQAMATETD